MSSDRMNSHPKWINPCGIGAADTQHPPEDEGLVISDGDLLTQIINQARIALNEADHFKHDYVSISGIFHICFIIWRNQICHLIEISRVKISVGFKNILFSLNDDLLKAYIPDQRLATLWDACCRGARG